MGAFALGAAAVAGPATASILNWNLENVRFDDGGQMSGTFSVDTADGAVTAFDITTTTGSILAGFHYDEATSFASGDLLSGNLFIIGDNDLDRYVLFNFANPLTSGGVDPLLPGSGGGSGSYECNNCVIVRDVLAGGDARTIPVPEPSIWAMILVGFAGLGFAGRHVRHQSLPV